MVMLLVYFVVIVIIASLALWAVQQLVTDETLRKVFHVCVVVATVLLLLGLFLRAFEVPLNRALIP